jgi:hypothetical protein
MHPIASLCALIVLIAACAAPPPDLLPTSTPRPTSAARTLAEAPQADAPALWIGDRVGVAAWIGADSMGVHIDARTFALDSDTMQSPVVLPLPPRRPTGLTLHSAPRRGNDTRVRALWLDADDSDTTQLYVAVIAGVGDGRLRVERGPIQVSDRAVTGYAAAVDTAGTLWAAWRSGNTLEPTLYLSAIDGDGRAQPPRAFAAPIRDMTLTMDIDGTLFAFWSDGSRLYRMQIADGTPLARADLTNVPALGAADRVLDMRAGRDATHQYVFWNIERFSDGVVSTETWWTTGRRADEAWTTPTRFTAAGRDATAFVVRRIALADSIFSTDVTFAADSDAGIIIGSLRAGALTTAQALDARPTVIGALQAARGVGESADRVWIAWADAHDPAAARLTLMHADGTLTTPTS